MCSRLYVCAWSTVILASEHHSVAVGVRMRFTRKLPLPFHIQIYKTNFGGINWCDDLAQSVLAIFLHLDQMSLAPSCPL